MRKILPFITLLLLVLTGRAQESEPTFWQRIDSRFGLSSTSKIDTTYYTLARHGWMLNLNNNVAGFIINGKGQMGLPYVTVDDPTTTHYTTARLRVHSNFNYQVGATAGYRNLILGYSFATVSGKAKDMTLSIAANAWGVEYRRLRTDDFSGTLENYLPKSLPNDVYDVKQGDLLAETKYLRAYHVFNSRRFSMTAANDQRCVQRRSAGSMLFYANYAHNRLQAQSTEMQKHMGVSDIRMMQGSVGLGYGYNYTPNQGRLLFHASVVPMIVGVKQYYLTTDAMRQITPDDRYFLNCMARFTANYRFNDHFGLCLFAFWNSVGFRADNLRLRQNDYLVKISLCTRF